MAITTVTTIETYGVEVCKRLGRQYSLYKNRAVELLPEAIRQTLLKNQYEANELFRDEAENGTIVYDKEIVIPATAQSTQYIENADSRMLQILNTVINVRGTDCTISAIEPNLHAFVEYMNFVTSMDMVIYYMDSNHMIMQNLTSPLAVKHAVVSLRKTQFDSALITDTGTNIGLYFSYNLLLQIIATGAEILKQEVTE